MNGKSHFAIGIGVSVAVAYIGIKNNDIALCATAVTAPLGAMLPDIDHNNSKLGRQRKQTTDTIKKITILGGFGAFTFSVISNFLSAGTFDVATLLLNGLLPTFIAYLPVIICIMLATSDGVKKRVKFFTKHRGIMHTVLPVVGLYIGAISSLYVFISSLLLGLAFGYTSHLFADCETKAGCPILWPLYKKNISILPVTTGTAAETLVMLLDLGGLACLAYFV